MTLVFLVDGDNARVFFGVFFDYFGRVISGAVVDDDNFEILISLSSDRSEAFVEILGSVVDRNNDGDFRFGIDNSAFDGGRSFISMAGVSKDEFIVEEII